ncbi:hypothetical protein IFM89_001916 [Coptis chinensis]|uniref:F-box domain-containing protein n=1 Tax=Coptis chinensis TaxID=261450 RepID=A0A835IGH3_9MAGN|nr:hypothetical protein IFM89_001916 [Coptis chinensis]
MAATDASIVVKKKQRLRGGLGRHNYFKSLPEEISLEILHRLTAEDLSSCKCPNTANTTIIESRKELKMPFLKLKKWGTEEQVVDENDKGGRVMFKSIM